MDDLGEVGQDLSIERIGLGQLAHGPGTVAHLAGGDHGEGQPRGGQGRHHCSLPSARGLQHDQLRLQVLQLSSQVLPSPPKSSKLTGSVAVTHCCPLGRTAISNGALATSIPT